MTGDLCAVWSWDAACPLWAKYLQMFLQPTALNAGGTQGQDEGQQSMGG